MSEDSVHPNGTDTIVLIHGLWVTALSWEHWVGRYRARGYRVLAPNWPGMDAGTEELRRDPSAAARLGVTEITDHYDRLIRVLGHPPAIIGHSVGGLIVQILLGRGLGAVGVAIHPAPVKSVQKLPLPMLRTCLRALWNTANPHTAMLTPRQFHRTFTNTLSKREALAVHKRYHVPAPSRIICQLSIAGRAPPAPTSVDFESAQRAPLLLIAGGKDRIFPAVGTLSTFKRYRRSAAITAYQEFPSRSHYTIGEPGWEQVADYALRWAVENARNGI